MSTVNVDSRGRVYIPKSIRERHGDKFKLVELESGIKLIPLDEDPVEGLKQAMSDTENIELGKISDVTEKKAKEELRKELLKYTKK